jgi:hypothetical protein
MYGVALADGVTVRVEEFGFGRNAYPFMSPRRRPS